MAGSIHCAQQHCIKYTNFKSIPCIVISLYISSTNSFECKVLLLAHKLMPASILLFASSAPLKGTHHQYYLFPFDVVH